MRDRDEGRGIMFLSPVKGGSQGRKGKGDKGGGRVLQEVYGE